MFRHKIRIENQSNIIFHISLHDYLGLGHYVLACMGHFYLFLIFQIIKCVLFMATHGIKLQSVYCCICMCNVHAMQPVRVLDVDVGCV